MYLLQTYSVKLFDKTILDQQYLPAVFCINDPRCLEKRYRSQREGFQFTLTLNHAFYTVLDVLNAVHSSFCAMTTIHIISVNLILRGLSQDPSQRSEECDLVAWQTTMGQHKATTLVYLVVLPWIYSSTLPSQTQTKRIIAMRTASRIIFPSLFLNRPRTFPQAITLILVAYFL